MMAKGNYYLTGVDIVPAFPAVPAILPEVGDYVVIRVGLNEFKGTVISRYWEEKENSFPQFITIDPGGQDGTVNHIAFRWSSVDVIGMV